MDIGAHGKNDSAYLCWYGESRPNKGYFKATSGIWLVNEKKPYQTKNENTPHAIIRAFPVATEPNTDDLRFVFSSLVHLELG